MYYQDDTAASTKHFNSRATLRWTPSRPWDISLIVDGLNSDDNIGVFRYSKGAYATDAYKINHDIAGNDYSEDGNSQALNINYTADSFKITSITGVAYRTYTKLTDSDMWANPSSQFTNLFRYGDNQYTQELRVSSVKKGPLQWLGGLFGLYEDTDLDHKSMNAHINMVSNRHTCDIKTKGWAAFGQAIYTFMDDFHFTVGLRLDNQYLEGDYYNPVSKVSVKEDLSYTEILPRFSVSYDAAENVMAYATVAKGYLAGGFNWSTSSEENKFIFDPEYCWNYEVGLKSNWFNKKFKANLSAFYIAMDDKQVRVLDPESLLSTTTNAGKAYSYGLEVQLKATPLVGWEVFANFGYTQAKFDEFISSGWNSTRTSVVYEDLSGNYLPFAPEYTFNAGAQYRSAGGFMGRLDIIGNGKFYGDTANSCEQDPYQLVNLRLGYEAEDWEVYLWAKNLFDQEYLTWFSLSGSNMYAVDGAPRTFGVTVSYRF
jgi:iron complex outermembrane receptor protein